MTKEGQDVKLKFQDVHDNSLLDYRQTN